jgi:serine/threonine protein kinase
VFKANRFGCQPVAVKVLREESGKQIENFQREIELLRGLRDNNIVLFLGVCLKDKQLMLVTEFMPQGDLWNALNHSNSRKFSWYQRWGSRRNSQFACVRGGGGYEYMQI